VSTDATSGGTRVLAALPLPAAAHELGVAPRTLARWLAAGAPAVRRGRRGRGGRALVDVAAVRAWRASCEAAAHPDLEALAAELPELVADAVLEAFRQTEGPHKRATAGALAGAWLLIVYALLDRLRRDVPHLADPDTLPRQIGHLRAIYAEARRTGRQ
jgi:hypothetical protein